MKILGLVCYAIIWLARVTRADLVVVEQRREVPRGYILSGPAASDTMLSLRIALAQSNMSGLEAELYAVSDPASERYGLHLSQSEVNEYVRPRDETFKAVTSWLDSNGIAFTTISPARDWINISVTVSEANKLLDGNFAVFTRQSDGHQTIRTLSYSVPSNLKEHIDLIHPTVVFPVKVSHKPTTRPRSSSTVIPKNSTVRRDDPECSIEIVPECINILYLIPPLPVELPINILLIAGFEDQFVSRLDLQTFFEAFLPEVPEVADFIVEEIDDGENDLEDPSPLANLNMQYTTGIALNVPTIFLSVGPDNDDMIDGFFDLVHAVQDMLILPTVLLITYGFDEESIETILAIRLCNAYMALGVSGVSVIFSSGDGGVAGVGEQDCIEFLPTFPSTCPFVTSVGGVGGVLTEGSLFSSGGFSTAGYFTTPSYQAAATNKYISSLGKTYSGLYNPTGRGYPDVAVQAESYAIFVEEIPTSVDGTPAGATVFAAIISLLNDLLLTTTGRSLGFLNPFLYSTGSLAFSDITSGNNPGCNTEGFSASPGWDPITGLGTPNFLLLLAAAGLSLPNSTNTTTTTITQAA